MSEKTKKVCKNVFVGVLAFSMVFSMFAALIAAVQTL